MHWNRYARRIVGSLGFLALLLLVPAVLHAQDLEPPYRADIQTGLDAPARAPGKVMSHDCFDPANIIANCSFEEDFDDWIATDLGLPFFPLQVADDGISPGFGLFSSSPTHPTSTDLAVLHGFDGDGPGDIDVCQDLSLPGGSTLEFDYRAGWDLIPFSATIDRTFNVEIEPSGGGTPFFTETVLTAQAGTTNLDTGDLHGMVDLTAAGSGPARLCFRWHIPEFFTGPAFFQLDNVSLFGGPDLTIDKYAEVNGNTGSFHVEVGNVGSGTAFDVEVTDDLSEFLTVDAWTATLGDFDPDTGIWTIDSLGVGALAELWIDVTFDFTGIFENEACVTDFSATPEISGAASKSAGTIALCAGVEFLVLGERGDPDFVSGLGPGQNINRNPFRFRADLSLTKNVDNATPAVDDEITYTLTVLNGGPQSTANVAVTDLLPDCLEFVSATGSYDPATGEWDIGNLTVGESATLEITVRVTSDCSGEVTNTASISNSSLPDPDHIFNIFDEEPPVDDGIASATFTTTMASPRVLEVTGEEWALGGAYPNPFNPEAVIPFGVPESGYVRIAVYDMLGREVARLVEGEVSAGVHEVVFRAGELPTGVYLVRMEAQGRIQTQQITLIR
ncbi:MAG: T9SS type A sorting domain-containing protein [Rhodothermales bacterium]